jgi:hypothetical protein
MSVVGDFISEAVEGALRELLRKTTGTRRRTRRRRQAASPAERLRRIEKLLKPAKRQTSRKRTVRSRSKARRRAY